MVRTTIVAESSHNTSAHPIDVQRIADDYRSACVKLKADVNKKVEKQIMASLERGPQ